MAFRPDRMRQRRDEKGLSQRDLAKLMDTDQQTINRYEQGRKPAPDMLVKLADALDTSTDWLLNRTDYPKRLTKLHYEVWDAFDRGDQDVIVNLLRKHLLEQGIGKKPISRKKPPLT